MIEGEGGDGGGWIGMMVGVGDDYIIVNSSNVAELKAWKWLMWKQEN